MFACFTGNMEVAQLLIDKGGDINAQTNTGVTPLIAAVLRKQLPLVELLLDNCADLSLMTKSGKTALDVARSLGNAKIIKLIEENDQ